MSATANGMLGFMHERAEWHRVKRGEVPLKSAVEEMLRWDNPLQVFDRWVLVDDYEVAGEPIPKYQQVTMMLRSANRDPRRYDHPDNFDVGRGDTSHVSFGGGIYKCLGAPLHGSSWRYRWPG